MCVCVYVYISISPDSFYCRIPCKNRLSGPLNCPPVLFGSPQKGASPGSINLSIVPPCSNFSVSCVSTAQRSLKKFTEAEHQSPCHGLHVSKVSSPWLADLGHWASSRYGEKTICSPHANHPLSLGAPKLLFFNPESRHLSRMVPSISAANASSKGLKVGLGIKWKGRCSSFLLFLTLFLAPGPPHEEKSLLSCSLSSKGLY